MQHLPIFVYGTLKRGEVRERRWPHAPSHIEWATLRGQLRDLGPYPALAAGDELVLGELWHVEARHLAATLKVLDEIECCGNDDVDLYVRQAVACQTLTHEPRQAYVYYFANPVELARYPIVLSGPDGFCQWSKRDARRQLGSTQQDEGTLK